MATHSSVLAWRIPGTREPGGPPSMGSHRVGHDRSDLAAAAAAYIYIYIHTYFFFYAAKLLQCNTGDTGSIPGSGRSPEKEMATHSSIPSWKIP